ncbi:MAG TPA: 3-deoxy-manno-octulosonate cytidylyltransferase [Dissulfurispiraceae bacterium]|nr:3-deoxy-manno-octulosonate cytidylyltransferase [Dissulfurispiraceae bacterium]
MSAVAIIPARYASTRFPGKPLVSLAGKPIIRHVYERVSKAERIEGVFVATDSEAIRTAVEDFGGRAILTASSHQSGTDRIAEALQKLEGEGRTAHVVINVQGDEPLIEPAMVDHVAALMDDTRASMATLAKKISDVLEITDPNVVKVTFDKEGFALYFSRAPVPYHRDVFGQGMSGLAPSALHKVRMFKHIGIYAYRRDELLRFAALKPTWLEESERLEQLRALEHGFRIKVGETLCDTMGVDTPGDLERVKRCLNISS